MKHTVGMIGIAIAALLAMALPASATDGEVCITCHSSDMEGISPELREMFLQWKSSSHYRARVGCYDCHGGNVQGKTKDEIHKGRKDLKDPSVAVTVCGQCHRGQEEAFRQSRHYKAILDKKTAPSCVTCHGSRKASKLDPLDVPAKCAQCHNAKTGNHPDIPEQAARIFELFEQTKAGIATTTYSILQAEEQGKDISEQRRSLSSINQIVDDLSVSWHGFDLDQIQSALKPLPVNLDMSSFRPSVGDAILKIIKIIALSLVVIICLWWVVDKIRGQKAA